MAIRKFFGGRPLDKQEGSNQIKEASLEELQKLHPALWEQTSEELFNVLSKGQAQAVNCHLRKIRACADEWSRRLQNSANNPKTAQIALPHIVKAQMTFQALEKYCLAVATHQTSGTVRFNLWNGVVIQRLLFQSGLTRKPVSLFWFRFWWRLLSQKRLLMPLVQPKGIYCFYSKELIESLRRLIGDRSCLEIAAGDGTLARFLCERSVSVVATDDYSWERCIQYPSLVQKLDARQALEKHKPSVVLCSWPSPGNSFEKHVFNSKTVELYIVIGSRHKFACGDWKAYDYQNHFDWQLDEQLTSQVLPPELNPAVLVFRRKANSLVGKAAQKQHQ